MALEIKLTQKLSQSLLMTPQLQQAIKLLQLGRLEYIDALQKELVENPVLEETAEEEQSAGSQTSDNNNSSKNNTEDSHSESPPENDSAALKDESPQNWEDYIANFTDYRGSAAPKGKADYEDRPSLEATLTREANLVEHVLAQVRMTDLSKEEESLVLHIVGNLDKDGYLCCSLEEIAEACSCDFSTAKNALALVQSLDPTGVGARDLGECLLIQLEHIGFGDGLAATIVRNYLDKLERRKYDQIAKSEDVPVEEVYSAVLTIQSLEPRPGRQFSEETARYIIPDIYVYKDGNDYVISLNEDGLPKLRVSPYYLQLLQQGDKDNSGSRSYLTERLKAASWLIKSIHQRQQTIYRVTESIVKFQREFLDHGIEKLRPLVLKDVADDIGMHESTVSRVTTNKYVYTPQGVYELKFFFSTAIKTADGSMSSSSIKELIKNIIAAEKPESPVSDQNIVELLKQDNIRIARRTVAKYRESMGILSSSKRKKLF